ncbi:hypothetical protein VTN96DRAFT_6462 [Rasamsonia emersonii]
MLIFDPTLGEGPFSLTQKLVDSPVQSSLAAVGSHILATTRKLLRRYGMAAGCVIVNLSSPNRASVLLHNSSSCMLQMPKLENEAWHGCIFLEILVHSEPLPRERDLECVRPK